MGLPGTAEGRRIVAMGYNGYSVFMPDAPFVAKLLAAARANDSWLCVGLDPDPELAARFLSVDDPERWIVELHRGVIEATKDLVCCYKPNLAFFEAFGEPGMRALRATLGMIPAAIPTIGDAKRGDIPNTSRRYAAALFDELGFDAVTVSPYLGGDSLEPFFAYRDRGVFVLCKTSNAGASELQDVLVASPGGPPEPLFVRVARAAQTWDQHGTLGLVAGATRPDDAALVRAVAPHAPILVPGVGAQAGDLAAAVTAAVDGRGERALINASRSVVYAGRGPGWQDAARSAASDLRDAINSARARRQGVS